MIRKQGRPTSKICSSSTLCWGITHCKNQPLQFLVIIVPRVFSNLIKEFVYDRRLPHQPRYQPESLAKPRTRTGHSKRPAREPHNCKYLTPLPQLPLDPTMEDILPEMVCQLATTISKTIIAVAKPFGNSVAIYKITQARRVDCDYPNIWSPPCFRWGTASSQRLLAKCRRREVECRDGPKIGGRQRLRWLRAWRDRAEVSCPFGRSWWSDWGWERRHEWRERGWGAHCKYISTFRLASEWLTVIVLESDKMAWNL